MRIGGTRHPGRAIRLGVGRSLNKTYEGRPKNVLFQEILLNFLRANSYSLNFFLFLIAKNFFNQRLFLLILFIFVFHFIQHSKRFRHFKKRDIACVLVLCLLHVVGTVASVICLSLKGCLFN